MSSSENCFLTSITCFWETQPHLDSGFERNSNAESPCTYTEDTHGDLTVWICNRACDELLDLPLQCLTQCHCRSAPGLRKTVLASGGIWEACLFPLGSHNWFCLWGNLCHQDFKTGSWGTRLGLLDNNIENEQPALNRDLKGVIICPLKSLQLMKYAATPTKNKP